MRRISWLAEKLSASQKGRCSMQSVISSTQFIFYFAFLVLIYVYSVPSAICPTPPLPCHYISPLGQQTRTLYPFSFNVSTWARNRMLTDPWRIALLQKPTATQLVNTFPAFYGTRSFLRQTNSVHTIPFYLRSILILFSHIRLRFPSDLLPTGFRTKTLYALRFATSHPDDIRRVHIMKLIT